MTNNERDLRYEFATKIVRLVEDIEREILSEQVAHTPLTGSGYIVPIRLGAPPVNWNWAVMTMQTDSIEEMIVCDVYRCSAQQLRNGSVDVDSRVRERIGILFTQHKLLVAELELGGLRYGTQS